MLKPMLDGCEDNISEWKKLLDNSQMQSIWITIIIIIIVYFFKQV